MTEDRLKQLFTGYLEGLLSGEELLELRKEFIRPGHAALMDELMKAAFSNPAYRVDGLTDKEKVLDEVVKRGRVLSEKRPVSKWIYFYAAGAAAVVIIFAGVMWFHTGDKGKGQTANQSVVDIAPAAYTATLTLADGRKIRLGDAVNEEGSQDSGAIRDRGIGVTLAREGGMVIEQTDKGEIVYRKEQASTDLNVPVINMLTTARHEQFRVTLPDGSHVWLNSESTLKYPVVFRERERKVELSGEGFFEVSANSKLPFEVVTGRQTVKVLGTQFNINAYKDEPGILTTVTEGAVRVETSGGNKVLHADQQSINKQGVLTAAAIDPEAAIAWKNGYFMFDNKNLASIMREIARWYDVDVVFEDHSQEDQVFAGSIPRLSRVSEVLNLLGKAGNVRFKMNGNQIIITK